MNWKLPCALLGLVLVLNVSAFAQCTWCTSVTDACCDGHSSVDYLLPCATSVIYWYYDGSPNNKVEVTIFDVTAGETLVQDLRTGECDCYKTELWSSLTAIPSGNTLRFKVRCFGCAGDCDAGNVTVKFFTPSGNTCAPNCDES